MKTKLGLVTLLIFIFVLFSFKSNEKYEKIEKGTPKYILGKKLFFDPILSKDSTISCASCHTSENLLAEKTKFSTGVRNQVGTRNSMPLFNLKDQDSFFWDGRVKTLEEQIFDPINNPIEMDMKTDALLIRLNKNKEYKTDFYKIFKDSTITQENIASVVAYFLKTINCEPPIVEYFHNYPKKNKEYEMAFYKEFVPNITQNVIDAIDVCQRCHIGNAYGGIGQKNTGLPLDNGDYGVFNLTGDSADFGVFKIPTLFNIKYTAPYMHDGRFETLREVINFYNKELTSVYNLADELKDEKGKPLKLNLSEDEIDAFLVFFDSCTDSTFIQQLEKGLY